MPEITLRVTVPESPPEVPVLRAAAQAAADATSIRAAAQAIGMSDRGLNKFLLGAEPYSPTLRRLRRWYQKHASTEDDK